MQIRVNKPDMHLSLETDMTLGKNTISIYDIEYEKGMDIEPNFRIFQIFDGLSQLIFNNSLYFCGAGMDDTNSGSYFFRFDPSKMTNNNTTILINSINHHYYPTLLGYKSDFVIIIGGLNSKFCEIYNTKTNKWKNLPELPEERYRCSTVFDDITDFIYTFGGLNNETKKNCTTILRLNMKTLLIWETLIVKHNASLLSRNSSGIIKFDKSNTIYILGGKDNDELPTDSIVEFDINTKIANTHRKKLESKCVFLQQNGSDLNKADFFLFDENYFIHKISKNDFKITLIDYKDINNEYE